MYILAYFTCLLLAVDHVQTIGMYLEPKHATFDEAVHRCNQRGMQLAIFHSLAEYDEAVAYIKSQSPSLSQLPQVWIGYIRKKVGSTEFEWINGETIRFDTPWACNEPGSGFGVRLTLRNSVYVFADDPYETLHSFLCTAIEEATTTDAADTTTHTYEELKTILAPVTEQLRKDLLVDRRNLSAYIYRHKTREDNRPSAMYLGYVGVTFLVAVGVLIILADVSSRYTKGHLKARPIH